MRSERRLPELKPLFLERMQEILPDKKDYEAYLKILKKEPVRSIRCNTIKIQPEQLKKKLEEKGWKVEQPWKENPEVMIINSELQPGELGRALEHLLGYYYIQELASMLPVIALKPKPNQKILDLCSSPGSKTTQLSAALNNTGSILANEVSLGRIKILASNLERCGCTNVIITKKDGAALCKRLAKQKVFFDKILVDAPCSGEGTLRSSPKTYVMWNPKTIKNVCKIQKSLLKEAISVLNIGGEIIYSTCTHAPEENEGVITSILEEFDNIKVIKTQIPIKSRTGTLSFEDEEYNKNVNLSHRIYPHDENTEGFFITKLKKTK